MGEAPLKFLSEVVGFSPVRERVKQTLVALRGTDDVPPSRMGTSSLTMLRPTMALPLWWGRPYVYRRVILTNLFNHTPTPIEDGWSVRRTQVRDFRGRDLTYDSHNGTDFAVPVGTPVLAAAPGTLVLWRAEFNRGGLKAFIDHGRGLMTCYAHLARPLVEEGTRVERGQPIALSGYSGLDGLSTFPLGVPHVHFNVWLNGEPVDPFPHGTETSMWLAGTDLPVPFEAPDEPEAYAPSTYHPHHVAQAIAACRTARVREQLQQTAPLWSQAAHLLLQMNYYPTRFVARISPYADRYERQAQLSMPFSAELFDGLVFADDL